MKVRTPCRLLHDWGAAGVSTLVRNGLEENTRLMDLNLSANGVSGGGLTALGELVLPCKGSARRSAVEGTRAQGLKEHLGFDAPCGVCSWAGGRGGAAQASSARRGVGIVQRTVDLLLHRGHKLHLENGIDFEVGQRHSPRWC